MIARPGWQNSCFRAPRKTLWTRSLLGDCLLSQHSWFHMRTICWSPTKTLHIECHSPKIWLWKSEADNNGFIKSHFGGDHFGVLGDMGHLLRKKTDLILISTGIPLSLNHLCFFSGKHKLTTVDYIILYRFSGFREWILLLTADFNQQEHALVIQTPGEEVLGPPKISEGFSGLQTASSPDIWRSSTFSRDAITSGSKGHTCDHWSISDFFTGWGFDATGRLIWKEVSLRSLRRISAHWSVVGKKTKHT